MLRALDEVFNCQSVSYAVVIRLDNIIRDFALSEALHPDLDSDASEPDSIARILQRAVSAIQPQKRTCKPYRPQSTLTQANQCCCSYIGGSLPEP